MTEPVVAQPLRAALERIDLLCDMDRSGHPLFASIRETVRAALAVEAVRPEQPSLVWHVEAAIEELGDVLKLMPEANAIEEARDSLHDGLIGKPAGLTAVGTHCPICGALRDPRGPMEPHR